MKRQKLFLGLIILSVLAAVVFLSFTGIRQLNAAPTGVGTVLTNTASVNWLSGSVNKSTNTQILSTAVGTNYGMTWIGEGSNTIEGGAYMTNVTWLTNDGNATADFILTSVSNVDNTTSKPWTNWFSNVTDGGAADMPLVVTISPGGGKNINLWVYAPPDETNNAYITFNCQASNSNAAANLGDGATNYTGLDGTLYGGNMGKWEGLPSVCFLTNGETYFTNWTIRVLVADVIITKTAAYSNTGPFGGITSDPYPGALITYRIAYTNRGGLVGTSVKIVDTLPTNYVYYTDGSMRKGTVGDALADYWTLASNTPTSGEDDDDGSTNDAALEQVVFCPTAGNAPDTGGSVAAGASGTYFFQAYLK